MALDELGMSPAVLERTKRIAARPHGMLLVTGPTGSGKTTTLYAALGLRDAAAEKVITVEDPVEYQLTGIAQVPVQRQAGVTFATALRSILRQDPDVIMVGEMRDPETAEVAVQAAMTGHLVLSTLHTNDAVGAVPRLLDLDVPDYLVAATLDAILAQRLVRRVCPSCLAEYEPHPDAVARISRGAVVPETFVHGTGCSECRGTGFHGRIGIFEFLELDDALREAVVRRAPQPELEEIAAGGGMGAMLADGWDKAVNGLTTVEEVLRVVQE